MNRRGRQLLPFFLISIITVLESCFAFQTTGATSTSSAFIVGVRRRPVNCLLLSSSGEEGSAAAAAAAAATTSTGPRGEARRRQRRQRQSGQRRRPSPQRLARDEPRSRGAASVPFDGKILCGKQTANEKAPPFDLFGSMENESIRCMSEFDGDETVVKGKEVTQPAFEFRSLDDLTFSNPHDKTSSQEYKLTGFSERFNTDAEFRRNLRQAMREDIYDTTPQYENLSPKAKEVLLLPDSSLQGSWRRPSSIPDGEIRMKRLTRVLQNAFADEKHDDGLCPTGDDLMQAIGDLCGPEPSTHFIDIVGVLDRTTHHSWHQDMGRSSAQKNNNNNIKTVLWGFPVDNNYIGCGVFSHVVPLQDESMAPASHPPMQPLLFDGTIDEEFIIRPCYSPGRELFISRDIDVLHSSPDVAYRTSVMRFM